MTTDEARLILDMAKYDMNCQKMSRNIYMHRNTIAYHLGKIRRETGLNPRRFYDLIKLVRTAREVIANDTQSEK